MGICFHENRIFLTDVLLLRFELLKKKSFNMINIVYSKHIFDVILTVHRR